jgi:hypothetical protein
MRSDAHSCSAIDSKSVPDARNTASSGANWAERNLLIVPNLVFISTWRTIRTIYPVAPVYMEIDAWAFLPRNESADVKKLRNCEQCLFQAKGTWS